MGICKYHDSEQIAQQATVDLARGLALIADEKPGKAQPIFFPSIL